MKRFILNDQIFDMKEKHNHWTIPFRIEMCRIHCSVCWVGPSINQRKQIVCVLDCLSLHLRIEFFAFDMTKFEDWRIIGHQARDCQQQYLQNRAKLTNWISTTVNHHEKIFKRREKKTKFQHFANRVVCLVIWVKYKTLVKLMLMHEFNIWRCIPAASGRCQSEYSGLVDRAFGQLPR